MNAGKLSFRLAIVAASVSSLCATASAAPIQYSFTSGPMTNATGTGVGLFGPDAYVTGKACQMDVVRAGSAGARHDEV